MKIVVNNAEIVWGLILAIAAFVVGNAAAIAVIVKMPSTYFLERHGSAYWANRHPALRWTLVAAKNLAGVVAILLGLVMILPGVPGPGLLLILIGTVLVDFPGKRRLERNLVQRPHVLSAVNSLRKRFGASPLVFDGNASAGESSERPGPRPP